MPVVIDLCIKNGTVLGTDGAVRADVLVDQGRIQGFGTAEAKETLDASGCVVSPGLVQAHVHVCQTLCRGHADDLPLLEWLSQRVWPYEASLDEAAMRACARLAA